jgi:hypothetical protein
MNALFLIQSFLSKEAHMKNAYGVPIKNYQETLRMMKKMTNWIWANLGTISLLESLTEAGVIIVDVRDLTDCCRDIESVKKKIMLVSSLLSCGNNVAIRCVAGMNRSNCIAVAVMCYMVPHGDVDESWDYHFKVLKSKVRREKILPDLERTAKKALKEMIGNE